MKVSKEFIESQIAEIKYLYPTKRMTICVVITVCGFEELGHSICAEEKDFDPELAKQYSYEDALSKLYAPYNFAIGQRIYEQGLD